jgi:hypothetical protein
MMLNNRNDASKPYYGFIQLLDLADMYDTETQSINAMVESCLLFLPTTNAIKQAILDGKVPGLLTTNTTVNDSAFLSTAPLLISRPCSITVEVFYPFSVRLSFPTTRMLVGKKTRRKVDCPRCRPTTSSILREKQPPLRPGCT